MIDWFALGSGATWVLGLAVLLATLSVADWSCWRVGCRLRDQLNRTAYRVVFDSGMILVCVGLLAGGRPLLEQVLWGLMAAWFVGDAVQARRGQRHERAMVQPAQDRPVLRGDDGDT